MKYVDDEVVLEYGFLATIVARLENISVNTAHDIRMSIGIANV